MSPFLTLVLFLLILAVPVQSDQVSPAPAASQATQGPSSSAPGAGTAEASGTPADTALATPPKSRTDSVIVVKHSFQHREQIITGSVIMTCLMLMMVSMNNYNPR